MHAHNMIQSKAVETFGIWLITMDENGNHRCPVCECVKSFPPPPEGHRYKTNEEYFIDGPADAALAYCHEHNLITVN